MVAVAGAIGAFLLTRAGEPTVKVDEPAPPVVGTTLDGQPFDLASLRGRPIILNFWASWCGPCRDEFPLLRRRAAELGPDDLQIVGVLFRDQAEPARSFARQFDADWPTVLDPDGALARRYLVVAPPQSYFIDLDGVVRAIHIGEILDEDFDTLYRKIAS